LVDVQKRFGNASISERNGQLVLRLTGSTYRGTGVEFVSAETDLRALVLEMCKDRHLRQSVLESLVQADIENELTDQATAEQFRSDDALLREWLDDLDPEELYVVAHRHSLSGVSRRHAWDMPMGWQESRTIYSRALKKLPHGVGPRTLEKTLARHAAYTRRTRGIA
jgi:hypothetical protein